MRDGSCLCGAVHFTVEGEVPGAVACHCSQCRKQSGHFWVAGTAPEKAVAIAGPVRWFRSSENAERGFCPTCGSFLFWRRFTESTIDFAMGALEPPTDLHLARHIFVGSKGDYYEITDGLPQAERD